MPAQSAARQRGETKRPLDSSSSSFLPHTPRHCGSLTSVILASECVETQVQGQLILLVPQLLGNLGLHLAVLLPQLVVILRVKHFPGNWSINEILQVVEVSSVRYSDHKNGEVPALSLAQIKTLVKKLSKLLVNVRIRNISGKNIIVDNGDTLGIVKSVNMPEFIEKI